MEYPHYSNAPVVEAVIELRTEEQPESAVDRVAAVAKALSSSFPIQTELNAGQISVGISMGPGGSGPQVSSTSQRLGFRLTNQANSRVIQVRTNGFSYSHLQPYTFWDKFSQEASEYWSTYLEQVKPQKVSRCSLRYINRFDLPGPRVEPDEYFNLFPHIPDGVSDDINGLIMQLKMPQTDIGAELVVNYALLPSPDPDKISILLDLDIWAPIDLAPTDSAVWEKLEMLRQRKNAWFNSAITDKAKDLIR